MQPAVCRLFPALVESPQTPQVDLWEPIETREAIDAVDLSAFGHAGRDRTHNVRLLIGTVQPWHFALAWDC